MSGLPKRYRAYQPVDRLLVALGRVRLGRRHPAMAVRNRANRLLFRTVLTSPGTVDIRTRDDFTIRVRLGDQQAASVLFEQQYAPAEVAALSQLMAEADAFLDVGSNYGYFSMLAGARGVRQIVAIEPNPRLAPLIRQSASINGFDVKVSEVAIGEGPGTVRLAWDDRLSGSGAVSTVGTKVPMVTLEEAASPIVGRLLVKVDVEGHEVRVLRSGPSLFRRQAIFSCEVFSQNADALFDLLDREGYSAFEFDGRQVGRAAVRRRRRSDLVLRPGAAGLDKT